MWCLTHWLQFMMTSCNGKIFRVTGPLCEEFTGPDEVPAHRPVTRSFGVFFDLRLNKRSSKQPPGWWFETPSWSLWRQYNVKTSCKPSMHRTCLRNSKGVTNGDVLRSILSDHIDDKSILYMVMTRFHQPPSHYQSQYWQIYHRKWNHLAIFS